MLISRLLVQLSWQRHLTHSFLGLNIYNKHKMAEEDPKGKAAELPAELRYIQYEHALEKKYLPSIRALISKDLSEPYSIYVYRYFLYQWGDLCFMVPQFPFPQLR
jgi:hypothetical protein